MHRGVAVAVGDVDVAVPRDGHVGRVVERRPQRRTAALAEREHHLPVRRELQDLVLVTVTDEDVVVRRDVDAVGIAQAAVAPAREEVPVGVEDEDRGILPLVEVDAIA